MTDDYKMHREEGGEAPEGGGGLGRWVAIFTAIVATLGAVVGHEAGETANKALLLKNEAILKKAEAADQWSYYQSVSTKGHLMELALAVAPADKTAGFQGELDKYNKQKTDIQNKAQVLEKQSDEANAESSRLGEPREKLATALALMEIAIAVGSVTVLSRQTWLFAFAIVGGLAGLVIAGMALMAL
jgi:hypothetical protein